MIESGQDDNQSGSVAKALAALSAVDLPTKQRANFSIT
jgi:hypothetical protein